MSIGQKILNILMLIVLAGTITCFALLRTYGDISHAHHVCASEVFDDESINETYKNECTDHSHERMNDIRFPRINRQSRIITYRRNEEE